MNNSNQFTVLNPITPSLPGRYVIKMMRKHRLTIRALADRMQISQARVRIVRNGGVEGRGFVQDWVEALTQ